MTFAFPDPWLIRPPMAPGLFPGTRERRDPDGHRDHDRHGGRRGGRNRHGEHDARRMHHEERRGRGGRNRHPGAHGMPFPPAPPWAPVPPMPPPPHPPMGGFGPPRKARRGDVRAAILALLAEGPHNGYRIMQEIGERSHGAWRPSPGAVYPALQQLTEEGLIQQVGQGRRTVFELTDAGTTYIAENPSEVDNPWEAMIPQIDEEVWELYDLASQTYAALSQVVSSGSPAQRARARRILEESRRGLYRILADGDTDETSE